MPVSRHACTKIEKASYLIMSASGKRTVAEDRQSGSKAPRPKDASTLILYRKSARRTEILMGERSGKHRFMPNTYVFPGGRVDAVDSRVKAATEMRPDVLARLLRSGCSPARARAMAIAAVRETFEETGLRISSATHLTPGKSNMWQTFSDGGHGPALGNLDYVARAVTPPARKMRFNTYFFVADADESDGSLAGSGELEDLKWVTIEEAYALNIPKITEFILGHVDKFLINIPAPSPNTPVILFKTQHGKRTVTTE